MAISNMLPQIWSARILAKLEKNLVFAQPGVATRDYEGDIRADGDRVHIHSFNDLTIGTYTKNSTTITYENLTDTRVTLLIDQSKYFAFQVDDIDAAQMRPELINAASDRAAYQLAEVADSYVAGLYSGASTSAPDNTIETSEFTASNVYQKFVDLSVLMDQVNLPSDGRYAVIPPWVKGLLLQNSSFLAAVSGRLERRGRADSRYPSAGLQQRQDNGHIAGGLSHDGRTRLSPGIRRADSERRGLEA
jgi:hypothetical protein